MSAQTDSALPTSLTRTQLVWGFGLIIVFAVFCGLLALDLQVVNDFFDILVRVTGLFALAVLLFAILSLGRWSQQETRSVATNLFHGLPFLTALIFLVVTVSVYMTGHVLLRQHAFTFSVPTSAVVGVSNWPHGVTIRTTDEALHSLLEEAQQQVDSQEVAKSLTTLQAASHRDTASAAVMMTEAQAAALYGDYAAALRAIDRSRFALTETDHEQGAHDALDALSILCLLELPGDSYTLEALGVSEDLLSRLEQKCGPRDLRTLTASLLYRRAAYEALQRGLPVRSLVAEGARRLNAAGATAIAELIEGTTVQHVAVEALALSLAARLAIAEGDPEAALDYARSALDACDSAGITMNVPVRHDACMNAASALADIANRTVEDNRDAAEAGDEKLWAEVQGLLAEAEAYLAQVSAHVRLGGGRWDASKSPIGRRPWNAALDLRPQGGSPGPPGNAGGVYRGARARGSAHSGDRCEPCALAGSGGESATRAT
jgi:hypothetical protein